MRLLLSLFSVVFALAVYVNAVAIGKRDVSAPVALCISDITGIDSQFLSLKTTVDGITSGSGYTGLLSVHAKTQTVVSQLLKAGTDCCAISGTISTDEANAILTALTSLVPGVEGTMTSLVTKKPIFQSVLANGVSLIKSDIVAMHTKHTPLNTCLLASQPPILIPEQKSLLDRIDAAYVYAEKAYTNSPSTV